MSSNVVLGILETQTSNKEKEEFFCDCRGFDWDPFLTDYMKGMVIYCLKEHQVAPEHGLTQVILK